MLANNYIVDLAYHLFCIVQVTTNLQSSVALCVKDIAVPVCLQGRQVSSAGELPPELHNYGLHLFPEIPKFLDEVLGVAGLSTKVGHKDGPVSLVKT